MPSCQSYDWNRFLAPPAEVSQDLVEGHAGACILITGAGGSIGSALVRAISSGKPSRIVLLESSEPALFEVIQQLEASFPGVAHEAVLGSCGDPVLEDDLLRHFRPGIIYHAAAFKHVPLLESNPFAAVRNNALATYTLARAAARHHTPKLVLISTDKAVNPSSLLGVTKRISELAVVSLNSSSTRMNAVRLANVIGSSGSVVPIFLRQMAGGGPVTVTHADAVRRFVSMPEAIGAILAAGASDCGGRILLPPMGEPVRIADLARSLIGARPREHTGQIEVRFTGLRPGEKVAEDLVFTDEVKEGKIDGRLEVIKTPGLGRAELAALMERLAECAAERDLTGLMEALHAAVPEYCPAQSGAAC